MSRVMTSFGLAIAVMALGLAACEDEFTSRSTLEGYRVVGIEASPPEVTQDGSATLMAHDYYDGSHAIHYRWTVCAYNLGVDANYECADPSLEFELGDEPTVVLDLAALGFPATLARLDQVPNPDGTTRSLERGFDILARLESGPDCNRCKVTETVKRIHVRDSAEAANQNPVIEELAIDGNPARVSEITLRVRTDAPERYRDPSTGERQEEEYLYSWYSTIGEADPALTFGTTRETQLLLPEGNDDFTVWVAVRDGRGGFAVERRVVSR